MDIPSYIMGVEKGERKGRIVFPDGSAYVFTDPNGDGHIKITERGEENNG